MPVPASIANVAIRLALCLAVVSCNAAADKRDPSDSNADHNGERTGGVPAAVGPTGDSRLQALSSAAIGSNDFNISCSNASHLNGSYQTNEAMCEALAGLAAACAEATAFQKAHCAAANAQGASQPTPSSPTQVPQLTSVGATSAAAGATSFDVNCANGSNYNGSYNDHAIMCSHLFDKIGNCPVEAGAAFKMLCDGTYAPQPAPVATAPAPAPASAPLPSPQVPQSPRPAFSASGATSFNVNCANGSNYNGSYSTHAAMCSHLADKISSCPAEASAVYRQLCN